MTPNHATKRCIDRRRFVLGLSAAGAGLVAPRDGTATTAEFEDEPEEEVTPTEDLMREHGVLKRVLLVYGEAGRRIDAGEELPPEPVRDGARLLRTFIEDYHEKLEEDYLFPRFEEAGRLTELTAVLREQHRAGRLVTDRIERSATAATLSEPRSAAELRDLLRSFTRMYAPHEAREDTVLFPALKEIVSGEEYGALGEEFEKREHELFGEGGFEAMVDRVASLERALGIYELAQFTPAV